MDTQADTLRVTEALTRIQMDYIEMPELKLTVWQAGRLWNLPVDRCEAALATLVRAGFLRRRADGTFLRRSERR